MTSPFQVEQVAAESWDDFKNHPLASSLARIFLLAYSRDIIKDLEAMAPGFSYIERYYGSNLIISMLNFTLEKVEKGDAEEVIETVSHLLTEPTRGDVMTLAQQLEQRGMQQGMHRGMQNAMVQIAKKQLTRGIEPEIIAEDTGLSIAEIKDLKQEIAH